MSRVRMRAGVIAVTIAAGGVLAACGASVQEFEAGQCLELSQTSGNLEDEVPVVDCEENHTAEVFHVFDMPDGDFPGLEGIQTEAQDQCTANLADYVGSGNEMSMNYTAIHPTQETWDEADDRQVACIIVHPSETTGSVRQ